jgi:hypothetical protein
MSLNYNLNLNGEQRSGGCGVTFSILSESRSHWRNVSSDLSEFFYKEHMLYLILNQDDTFELRWVDYLTIRYR